MPRDVAARDQAQRRMLVALAESAPLTRRRPKWGIALAAFALSGALSGAAVSAAAAAMISQSPGISYQRPTADTLAALVPGGTRLIGEPLTVEAGNGSATFNLGPMPEGATQLFISFGCVDEGTHTTSVDGQVVNTYSCSGPTVSSGGGSNVTGPGPHTIEVVGAGDYALWASWSAPAVPPPASAEQNAATADGTVTETEYREGFARYAQCMDDAGYPVDIADAPGPLISYTNSGAAVESGNEATCYASEFRAIDMGWQLANQ